MQQVLIKLVKSLQAIPFEVPASYINFPCYVSLGMRRLCPVLVYEVRGDQEQRTAPNKDFVACDTSSLAMNRHR